MQLKENIVMDLKDYIAENPDLRTYFDRLEVPPGSMIYINARIFHAVEALPFRSQRGRLMASAFPIYRARRRFARLWRRPPANRPQRRSRPPLQRRIAPPPGRTFGPPPQFALFPDKPGLD